jgi:SAM-dependent methyltransferase
MTVADRQRWDAKYSGRTAPTELAPPAWLVKHASERKPGRALDLACGCGHAAIWLAERGWTVTALDISPVGLSIAQEFARFRQARVEFLAADLDTASLGDAEFDLITVFRFLDRKTLPRRIAAALRPGGRLLYETFLAVETPRTDRPIHNPAYLLNPGELLRLFASLRVVEYEEVIGRQEGVARLAADLP